MQAGKFLKINKRAGWNKAVQVGIFKKLLKWNACRLENFPKLINVQDGIRPCRLEFFKKLISCAARLLKRLEYRSGFSQKGLKSLPQIHIRKFEEYIAWGRVSYWGLFLTSTGSALTQITLWMSEMNPRKAPILKPFVLQIFWCEFRDLFRSFLRKPDLYRCFFVLCLDDVVKWHGEDEGRISHYVHCVESFHLEIQKKFDFFEFLKQINF